MGNSNATRSSPSDQAFGQLNDHQHHLQQQQQQQNNAAKMNVPQQQQQPMLQHQPGGLNQQIQQPQNVYFTAADGSTNLLVNQSLNPFTNQQQGQQQQQQQQAIQSIQTGLLPGQQLQTSNYASSSVFPNNALSQIDQQQQQQMALQQQQQLQLQQQLGQANNPMMVNENTVGGPLFQQNKQLTQINSSNPQSLQQQQQQQPYGLVNTTGTGGYVQQVAQVRNAIEFLIFHLNLFNRAFIFSILISNLNRVEWPL